MNASKAIEQMYAMEKAAAEHDPVVEAGAAIAHDQWSGWMKYLFSKCEQGRGPLVIPKQYVERWSRQMKTPYEELSEEEKESDRKEARKYIELMRGVEKTAKWKREFIPTEDYAGEGSGISITVKEPFISRSVNPTALTNVYSFDDEATLDAAIDEARTNGLRSFYNKYDVPGNIRTYRVHEPSPLVFGKKRYRKAFENPMTHILVGTKDKLEDMESDAKSITAPYKKQPKGHPTDPEMVIYRKSASFIIDRMYTMEKTAGVGWDVHGYKKQDLDKFYGDAKALGDLSKINHDTEKELRSRGLEYQGYSNLYPREPKKPNKPGFNPKLLGLTTALGAAAGVASTKSGATWGSMGRRAGLGAAVGVGLYGALKAPGWRRYLQDKGQYQKELGTYEYRLAHKDEAQAKNKVYWEEYRKALSAKYTPEQVQMILDEDTRPYNLRVKTPHDHSTNYKLNERMMGDFGEDSKYYDDLTDEVYGDSVVKDLSVDEIEAFKAKYMAAADRARQSGGWKDDPYFEPGVKAFTDKIDALKASGADTFRLEYE